MGQMRFFASWASRALCTLVVLASAPASGATMQIVPGVTMEMEAPAGQCQVEPSASQFDALYAAAMQQMFAGSNNLLAYFIPCDALAMMRQGVAQPINEWTVLLLPLSGGQVMSAAGYTRAQALDELAKAASTTDIQSFLDGQKGSIESRVAEVIKQDVYQMNQLKSMGVLARDDAGIYSGVMMNQVIGGQMETIACVYGMTLVNGYVVTLNIYRPYESPATFSTMVEIIRAQMARIIAANGGAEVAAAPAPAAPLSSFAQPVPDSEDAGSSSDDGARLLLLIGGGVAVVVIGGLVGFFLTRRKTGQG